METPRTFGDTFNETLGQGKAKKKKESVKEKKGLPPW